MLPDEPYDSANPEHIKATKNKAKIADNDRKKDLCEVWGTPAGRRVMWELISFCGLHRMTYQFRNPSPNALYDSVFLEGARNVGNKIQADALGVCPELFLLAQQEAQKKEKETHE